MRAPRATAAALFAVVAMAYAWARMRHEPTWPTDFDQLWFAARALRTGENPYDVVGPGRAFAWDWPLFYPLPAVLAAVPFSWLPVTWARVAFATAAAGTLGFAIGPRLAVLWPMALSAAFLMSAARTQWSPFVLAAAWLPALSILAIAKPTIGLASLAPHLHARLLRDRSTRRTAMTWVAAASAVLILSLVLRPTWISDWRSAIATATHIKPPVASFPGWLLALAALRWRRPEARLLLVMACVPHTPSVYDLLPLFFLCRTLRDSLSLALLTHLGFWGNIVLGGGTTFDAYAEGLARVLMVAVYLPALVMVLRRPNVDEPPISDAPVGPSPIPGTRVDATLTGLLGVAAFVFVWIPLVTTR